MAKDYLPYRDGQLPIGAEKKCFPSAFLRAIRKPTDRNKIEERACLTRHPDKPNSDGF
jgi:hypothetical protein